jgi:triosephosphate isomerase
MYLKKKILHNSGVKKMKKPIFGCGWKMYLSDNEAVNHAKKLKSRVSREDQIELYVLPSFTAIRDVKKILEGTDINVGAQNMCWEDKGAFTGEVSIRSLREIGIKYIEIGHSERREFFGETDETCNKKLKKALEYDMIPIFCIGENAAEKEYGLAKVVMHKELTIALHNIDYEDAKKIIYAYEPVWAIGKDDAADPDYVEDVQKYIRHLLTELYPMSNQGIDFKVVYGGSVSLKNVSDLVKKPNIDGVFVGRSSLDVDNYERMLEIIKKDFKYFKKQVRQVDTDRQILTSQNMPPITG